MYSNTYGNLYSDDYYNIVNSAAYRAGYTIGIVIAIASVVALLIVSIFLYIAWGKMFKKAGQPWERLFVPFYGMYWMYKIANCQLMFWVNLILAVMFPTGAALLADTEGAAPAILLVWFLSLVIMWIVYCVKLAKAYGKGVGFSIGLMLLNPIFILILGFGGAKYQALNE